MMYLHRVVANDEIFNSCGITLFIFDATMEEAAK
jgi:hypothetical protein